MQTRGDIANVAAGHLNPRDKLQPAPCRTALDPTASVCVQRGLGLGKSAGGCLTGVWPSEVLVTTMQLAGPFP